MRTMLIMAMTAAFLAPPLRAQDAESQPASRPPTPQDKVEAIDREVDEARNEFFKLYKETKTDEEKDKLFAEKYPKPERWFPRLYEIAASDPKGPGAEAALIWIVSNDRDGGLSGKALEVLLRDHVGSKRLAEVAGSLGYARSAAATAFLTALEEKSPHREVKGQALYSRAQQVRNEARTAEYVKSVKDPKVLKELESDLGADEVARLKGFDGSGVDRQVEGLLERVKKQYGDVDAGWGGTLGDLAGGDLFEIRNLAIGMTAPEIEGEDIAGDPMKLSDFRGKVVVLDFWGHW